MSPSFKVTACSVLEFWAIYWAGGENAPRAYKRTIKRTAASSNAIPQQEVLYETKPRCAVQELDATHGTLSSIQDFKVSFKLWSKFS